MKRSQLKNKVPKLGTPQISQNINSKRNLVVGMKGAVKLNYFDYMKTDLSEAKNMFKS